MGENPDARMCKALEAIERDLSALVTVLKKIETNLHPPAKPSKPDPFNLPQEPQPIKSQEKLPPTLPVEATFQDSNNPYFRRSKPDA